jgi:hypothetical protein
LDDILLRFRCLKHWIKGEKLGSTEIFIENLPGGPDNINIAADGRSYWIALLGVSMQHDLISLYLLFLRNIQRKIESCITTNLLICEANARIFKHIFAYLKNTIDGHQLDRFKNLVKR